MPVATSKEIKGFMDEAMNESLMFDFRPDVYAAYLDYEDVKELLKDGVTEESWNEDKQELTEANVVANMKDYMTFAIGKAVDHRGLSANRSIQKMQAYGKILGWYDDIAWDHYAQYGAPILKAICDKYGWQDMYVGMDDFLGMAAGKKCRPDCNEGCGY